MPKTDKELTVEELEQIKAKIQRSVTSGSPVVLSWKEALGLTQHIDYLHILRKTPPVPLLQKIVEICDLGSARELGDAYERLEAVRGLIVGQAV